MKRSLHRTLRVRFQGRWQEELRLGTIVEYLGISAVAFVVGAAHGFTDCEEAAHAGAWRPPERVLHGRRVRP